MTRRWKILVLLLGLQTLLCLGAVFWDIASSCAACRVADLSPALLGAALYGGLFVTALLQGPTRFLFASILFAFGVHVVLWIHLINRAQACGTCLLAGGLSLAMVTLSIACDRRNLLRLACLLPLGALAASGWTAAAPPPRPAAADDAVRIAVYMQPECPYCDQLRDDVLPLIRREFGRRLSITFASADDHAWVQRTPTLVLSKGTRSEIIEGLPDPGFLRQAILNVEEAP